MLENSRVGFIGGGNMGEALIKGLLSTSPMPAENLCVFDVSKNRQKYLEDRYRVTLCKSIDEIAQKNKILVLAVKPQNMQEVLQELALSLSSGSLIISIAAGVTMESIAAALPEEIPIIRVMPNTPALVQQGASALARGKHVSDEQMGIALDIFQAVGKAIAVEEKWMDAVTGLSGSGPAYVLMLIESFIDAGVLVGLPRATSRELVLQTFLGTVRMVEETGKHPAELKDLITSPAGTTIEGLKVLEEWGIRGALMEAVRAATVRSAELGKV